MAGDKYYPVECTAITPKAVGATADVPFEKAMQMAKEDLQKQQYKIFFPVQKYRGQGYASPELPDVDVDKVKSMLASREREAADEAKNVAQNSEPAAALRRRRRRDRQHRISLRRPTRDGPLPAQRGPGLIFLSGFLESFAAAHSVGHHVSRLRSVHLDGNGCAWKFRMRPRPTEALKAVGRAFARDRQPDPSG